MKKIIFVFISIILFISCNENEISRNVDRNGYITRSKDQNLELKKEFSQALAKVLAESEETRALIKSEALKKINHDYDVLYLLVKDTPLSDNTTLEQLLSKHISIDQLSTIETNIPTLTIFVPELPQNSFSAKLWNVTEDIPAVGIRTNETNDISIFESNGEEWVLEAMYIPGFPVVVVKENERIVLNQNNSKENNALSLKSTTGSTTQFQFVDEIFNNTTQQSLNNTKASRPPGGTPNYPLPDEISKVMDAYNIFLSTSNWHRDYIYYDLTTTQTRGRINKNYMEYIVGFELTGDAQSVISHICDQTGSDPMPSGDVRGTNSGWTDGEFEFMVKIYVASTTGIGNELFKFMRIKPQDLFSPEKIHVSGSSTRPTYYYTGKYILNKCVPVSLPLIEWNLETISSVIKIDIEEVDSKETVKKMTTTTSEFASNFEFNATTGDTEKVGLKWGSSAKKTMSTVYEVTETKGNDLLGQVTVNFWDDIIISPTYSYNAYSGNNYWLDYNPKYYSGYYRLYIAPKKMY